MEELVLERLFGGLGSGLFRCGRAARGRGDDGEQIELGDGGAGDVEALGVGAGIRRSEEEACVFGERVEEGEVDGREAFEEVAGGEHEADPEALLTGAREKGAAGEALGVARIVEVEVADEADELDVGERQRKDAAGEV